MLVYQCTEGYMPEERMEASWCINGQWTPNPVLLSCSKDSSAITTAVSTSVSSSTSIQVHVIVAVQQALRQVSKAYLHESK